MGRPNNVLLIVEDHDTTRTILARLMTLRGYDVRMARTVAEGLDQVETEPDFLILDLCLPDGAGEAILRRIRDANLRTRVAVTTAMQDGPRLDAVRGLGPDALLTKPVALDDLCRVCQPG
jgi:two-component system, response regulator RegA